MKKNQTNHKRVVYALSLIAVLLISGVSAQSESQVEAQAENSPAFILIAETADINAVIEKITEFNGTVSHVFPPQAIIAELSPQAEVQLLEDSIITVYRGPVDLTKCGDWKKETKYAAIAWNNNYMGHSQDAGLNEPPVSPEPPRDDIEILPDMSAYLTEQITVTRPYNAQFMDTSEYLVGSVAVGVLLLESNGTIDEETETWTEEEEANVTSEIQNGLSWLSQQEPAAHLSFVYEFHYSIPVAYEPVTRPHTDDELWEQQALHYLGYTHMNYLVNEYAYANALREKYKTDWAFIIFVVDDSEDEDNAFADGSYAYSVLGGPRMVVTYSNSIWGIANLDSVVAHETCHLFWALDEHCSSRVDQKAASGYLAGENANSEWNGDACTSTVSCIMKGEPIYSSQIEPYTRKQIGWSDSDSDGILDVVDTLPEVFTEREGVTFTGTAKVSPLPNANPFKQGNDLSLNTIAAVEYRVDGGEWIEVEPKDGAFDAPQEEFTFTLDIAAGEYAVEVRAQDSSGNWSEPTEVAVKVEEKALLTSEITAPATAVTGDTVTVTMKVQNTGEAKILAVLPVLNAPDTTEKVSGPLPESADISPGDTQSFEWTFQIKAVENTVLTFSGHAAGKTEAGDDVSSETTETTVEVTTSQDDGDNGNDGSDGNDGTADDGTDTEEGTVEPVTSSDIAVLLYGVIEKNTITVTMEVTNAGTTALEMVAPSALILVCTGTATVSLLNGPLPEPPLTLAPGEMKTFTWRYTAAPGAQGGTAVFTGYVTVGAEGLVTSDTAMATVAVDSPALLTTFLIGTPREAKVGDIITVALTVQNIGQAAAVDVTPSEVGVSGTGIVNLESGPSRTLVRVGGRSFEIIYWIYTALQEGEVTFSVSAQGFDSSTGGSISVSATQSNSVTIKKADPAAGGSGNPGGTPSDTSPPPPPSSPCEKVEETIAKVKELLKDANKLIEEKKKQNRDVSFAKKLLEEAKINLEQAEAYLKKGKCEEASRSAIIAMTKLYELLSFLKGR